MLAFADDYPAFGQWRAWGSTYQVFSPTQLGAAEAYCDGVGTYSGKAVRGPGSLNGSYVRCYRQNADLSWTTALVGETAWVLTCPGGGVLSGSICQGALPCAEGEERNETGQCVPPPLPECGNGSWNESLQICQCDQGWSVDTEGACTVDKCVADAGQVGRFGTINASSTCSFGCTATRAGVANSACVETQYDAYGQPTSWMCDMRITGEHCTSGWSLENPAPETEAGPKDGEEEGCPVGYYQSTFNGQTHCVMTPPATSEQTTEQKVTTHPDGTSTETTTTRTSEVNPDGSLQQTTTTTTTEKDASGNVTSTSTSSTGAASGLGGFCATNPGSQLCQGGGSFGGNCGSKPVCKGDAIQCAIAAATFEMQCALAVGEEVLDDFAAIQAFDGTGEGQGLDRKQIDVPETLVVSEIGGGAGLQDQTFTVMGETIVIPFSEINRFIEMFGYAIMMIAWIGAWRIIAGAF